MSAIAARAPSAPSTTSTVAQSSRSLPSEISCSWLPQPPAGIPTGGVMSALPTPARMRLTAGAGRSSAARRTPSAGRRPTGTTAVAHAGQQELGRRAAHREVVAPDDGDGRLEEIGDRDVVAADERQVPAERDAALRDDRAPRASAGCRPRSPPSAARAGRAARASRRRRARPRTSPRRSCTSAAGRARRTPPRAPPRRSSAGRTPLPPISAIRRWPRSSRCRPAAFMPLRWSDRTRLTGISGGRLRSRTTIGMSSSASLPIVSGCVSSSTEMTRPSTRRCESSAMCAASSSGSPSEFVSSIE